MKRLTKLCGVMVFLVAAGQLGAQPAPTDPKPAARTLSEAEMIARAEALATEVRLSLVHVQQIQTEARTQQDIIKLSCVNDRFVMLKAEANLFDTERADLTGTDASATRDRFRSIEERAVKIQELRQQADACVGKVELNVADSSFTSPVIIDDPTTSTPISDFVDTTIEPPGYASPFN